jgi:hypothetical protein
MKRTIQLMAGLMAGTFITALSALGQANFVTPYTVVTIAGTAGNPGSQNGLNGSGLFELPEAIVADTNDNLYVVDASANTLVEVSPAGGTNWQVTVIAGSANQSGSTDANNQNARFSEPEGIAMDQSNNLYVADTFNSTIRKVVHSGNNWVVTTIAGTAQNYGSNDGTNGAAQFEFPQGIAADASGNLYVADSYNDLIRKLTPVGTNWVVTTIAGTLNASDSTDGTNSAAHFNTPWGITADRVGNLFVADSYNANGLIREIKPVGTNWVVTTIAGSFIPPSGYTDGTNTDTTFAAQGISVDANDNLYVADTGDNVIRKISPTGDPGSTNGTGPTVLFNNPYSVAVDASGKIFVADTVNYTIREGYVAAVPNLNIGTDGSGHVVVSWPGSFGTLQTNSDLSTQNWAAYGGAAGNNNGTNTVTLTPTGTALYFRLTH